MQSQIAGSFREESLHTVKLGYNDHGYSEFTAITKDKSWNFWSQMATLVHKNPHGYNE